uniref:Uncharacterized protein n=1 Tax=Chrysotila carterae TaxID=13221 RepID=A0A7S4BV14_CHRCT
MLFLAAVLALTTALLCYAGYIFLIVDRRQAKQVLENPEIFGALDDKDYDFELPAEIDDYEKLREAAPTDKRALPVALLKRAMADIPRIEQLEKDHPRMARLFNRGLLPFGLWEQLLEAEAMMDAEVHEVQAEAEKLHKGWGQGVFSQAYQMLRQQREEEMRTSQLKREAATLKLTFTKLSGGVVEMTADGRNVTQQTMMVLRKEYQGEEIAFKCDVRAELVSGCGDTERTHSCTHELTLDKDQEKQWKQLGQDPLGLRLQVKFVRRSNGRFSVADIRATVPMDGGLNGVAKDADDDKNK